MVKRLAHWWLLLFAALGGGCLNPVAECDGVACSALADPDPSTRDGSTLPRDGSVTPGDTSGRDGSSPETPEIDAGPRRDAGSASDGGSRIDGGSRSDGGAADAGRPKRDGGQPGETCAVAIVLDGGTSFENQTLSSFEPDVDSQCQYVVPAPDRVYRLDVPARTALSVRLRRDLNGHAIVELHDSFEACESGACVGRSSSGDNFYSSAQWVNQTNQTKPIWISVRALDPLPYGNFDLEVLTFPFQTAGDTCADPVPLPESGISPVFSFFGATDNFARPAGPNCSFGFSQPDRTFEVSIPPLSQTRIALITGGPAFPPSLSIAEDVAACVAQRCSVLARESPNSLLINNPTTSTIKRILIAEREVGANDVAVFHFEIQVASLLSDGGLLVVDAGPPPEGEDCTTAIRIDAGVRSGQLRIESSLQGFSNDYRGVVSPHSSCSEGWGPDRAYKLTLPAKTGISVLLSTPFVGGAALFLATSETGCRTQTCVGRVSRMSLRDDGAASFHQYTNDTFFPQELFIVVRTNSPSGHLTARLDIELFEAPGTGEECFLLPTLSPPHGRSPPQSLNGYMSNFERFGEPDRAYQVPVPPLTRVTVTPIGIVNAPVPLRLWTFHYDSEADCAARRNQRRDTGRLSRSIFENRTLNPQTAILVVEGMDLDRTEHIFRLHTTSEPIR